MTIKCPICGGEATITDKDGVVEMDCPNCQLKIIKVGTPEENRDYFEGVKHEPQTADEMLAELGFRKNESVCYSEKLGNLLYEKPVQNETDIFELRFWNGRVTYQNLAHHSIWMHPPLVRAIEKKLEEMGWKE